MSTHRVKRALLLEIRPEMCTIGPDLLPLNDQSFTLLCQHCSGICSCFCALPMNQNSCAAARTSLFLPNPRNLIIKKGIKQGKSAET